MDTRPAPPPPAASASKKSQKKKAPEQTDAAKLLQQRISELEMSKKSEKGEHEELGAYTDRMFTVSRPTRCAKAPLDNERNPVSYIEVEVRRGFYSGITSNERRLQRGVKALGTYG
jgi:hypothetical protein